MPVATINPAAASNRPRWPNRLVTRPTHSVRLADPMSVAVASTPTSKELRPSASR